MNGVTPYFSATEIACRCGCGDTTLAPGFAEALTQLREEWGKPLHPSSVCRCPKRNTAVQGHPRSLHLTVNPAHKTGGAMAIDVRWHNWSREEKIQFCKLARGHGWSVGLHPAFCHLDRRGDIGLQTGVSYYDTWRMEFRRQDLQ